MRGVVHRVVVDLQLLERKYPTKWNDESPRHGEDQRVFPDYLHLG